MSETKLIKIINPESQSNFFLTWYVFGKQWGKYLPDKESLIDSYEMGVLHNVNGNEAWINKDLYLHHNIHGWSNCEECKRIKKKHGWEIKDE